MLGLAGADGPGGPVAEWIGRVEDVTEEAAARGRADALAAATAALARTVTVEDLLACIENVLLDLLGARACALFTPDFDGACTDALLPERLPPVPGLEVAARYRSATGSDVGGDWYDVLQLSNGTVGLVLGDVMGRGVRAASTMGQVRNALRGIAVADPTPVGMLTHLDRFFTCFDPDEITTLVITVIDTTTGALHVGKLGICHRYCSAPTAGPGITTTALLHGSASRPSGWRARARPCCRAISW